MSIRLWVAMMTVGTMGSVWTVAADNPSFHKDIEPILQTHCQSCHRPGQMAPMSFLTYGDTRPWAKAMKTAVATGKMPPWFADARYGHFLNDRSLSQTEVDTITRWVDSGAAEGAPTDAPKAFLWPEGWEIQPDLIIDGPVTAVPARTKNNVVEWSTVTIPSGFTHDTWVTSVEIRPEFPEVAHHICLGFNPHRPDVKYFEPQWVNRERDEEGAAIPDKGPTFGTPARAGANTTEDCYAPGMPAVDYRAVHAAKLVLAGSDIVLNLHYTPTGRAVTDHVKIGLTIVQQPPARRFVSFAASASIDPTLFAIPPNDANWPSPPAQVEFLRDAQLVFLMTHMHVRGKDATVTLEYPDGRKEVVLRIPRYDFNWQLGYNLSVNVPKGTVMNVEAHFDNSVGNKFNPNPNRTVYYGEMTWEEMMVQFFGVVVDPDADVKQIIRSRKATRSAPQ